MLQRLPAVFMSDGVPLVGNFYRSQKPLGQRQPAVVVTGSWLNVKEQMATHYARALAEQGYATFTFDFAGWGQSRGALRHAELPLQKARDLASAARFVASQAFVEPGRVAFLGVCASAQYGLRAIAEGAPFRSFIGVAGWFHDASSIAGFYGGDAGVALRLERAERALERYVASGEIVEVPAYAPGDDRAGMHFELDYYGNATRGAIPSWKNRMAELSWLNWLTYDGLSPAANVEVPSLLVHADDCALPDNAKLVHDRIRGKKRLAWLRGAQQDFYDQPAQLGAALGEATSWLKETL